MKMTLNELSQMHHLTHEIEMNRGQLEHLTAEIEEDEKSLELIRASTSGYTSPVIDGMPRAAGGGTSPVERVVDRITKLEGNIACKRALLDNLRLSISTRQTLLLLERERIEAYIAAIPDSYLRQLFTQRFINGLPWDQVAYSVGLVEESQIDGVKKACYRYIKALNG